nr:MAG TPA: hypothetical protein [Caudoviricetes sp.]
MEALEFLKERKRMCNSYDGCKGCPFGDSKCVIESTISDEDFKRIVATIEQWSKEHPRKTRQSVFLEQWPEAEISFTDGCLTLNPCKFYKKMRKECVGRLCSDCRREFWMQEVE